MSKIRITHETEYHYSCPVRFGPHQAMVRPREGHDLHILGATLGTEPASSARWMRDISGNSVVVLTFQNPAPKLRIVSKVEVEIFDDISPEFLLDPASVLFPFTYAPNEQMDIIPYRIPSYPYDGPEIQNWMQRIYRPGDQSETLTLLENLNREIFQSFRYAHRDEPGVQLPCRTLALGSGSCRDFAVFMMEAARHLGFAARFVTGYILMPEGQHGATHAWTEIYIPGAGWRGYDPTNNKPAGSEHVSVAVSRDHEKASPLSGIWEGPANAFQQMKVSVRAERM